jgi:hypothetical protein
MIRRWWWWGSTDVEEAMFRLVKQFFARLLRRQPPTSGPSDDPYAGVRHPRTRGPHSRDSAVAVMEPEPPRPVRAVGKHLGQDRHFRRPSE